MQKDAANISLGLRLGVSVTVSPKELELLKKEDKAAEDLLKKIIHSDRCIVDGDTYFPGSWNEEYADDDINFDLPSIPLHPVQRAGKLYMLCEEHEDDSGIREFYVHAVSQDKEGLKQLMKAKIEKDEYGTIALNGVKEDRETWFKTEFEEGVGILEYYILEDDVLQKEDITKLLKTAEYSDAFEGPDNMREVLMPMLGNYLKKMNLENIDAALAIDSILADKEFQAKVKTSWWGNDSHIDEDHKGLMNVIERGFIDFINQRLGPKAKKPTLDEMIEKARKQIEGENKTHKGREHTNDNER